MAEEVKPEQIKKTQTALNKYIKEPPLTEKLLKKPPFRFILDIVKSVVKETGYLKDVFTAEEFADSAKDKERKIAFMKKLISSVQNTTGLTITARPNKIVAGLEVNKTLELLQALGQGIASKDSGPPKKVENNTEKKKKPVETKEKKVRPDSRKSDDSAKSKTLTGDEKKKGKKVEVKRPPSRKPSVEGESKEIVTQPQAKDTEEKPEEKPKEEAKPQPVENGIDTVEEKPTEEPIPTETQNVGELPKNEEPELPAEKKDEKPPKREQSKRRDSVERKNSSRRSSSKVRPSSKNSEQNDKVEKAKEQVKIDEEAPVLGSTEVPVSVPKLERPQTARKPPPSARPPSSRPGAPKARDRGEVKLEPQPEIEAKTVPLIPDTAAQEDDKENLVTVEAQPLLFENDFKEDDLGDDGLNDGDEGVLVAQILETKRELQDNQGWTSAKTVDVEWEAGRRQKKELWTKEVNKVREGIQQLTRVTNPLGKLFDFLQEDVDSMQRELKTWLETNASYSKQLEYEEKLTESSLETYRRQLAELDSLIDQEQESVRNLKATLIANDQKIVSLITKTTLE